VSLQLVTAPASEPVTLRQLKTHLRVSADHEDTHINALNSAARQFVQSYTNRQLVTATFDWKLGGFPDTWRVYDWATVDGIDFPVSPVQSITSVAYLDINGVSQTWSSALYALETDWLTGVVNDHWMRPARLTLAYNEVWPSSRTIPGAVTIRFVAGYGAAAYVPEVFKHAIKLLVSHWYEAREAVVVGTITKEVEFSLKALLDSQAVRSM
jgi:uncharacterized phiE125 gp8 family phage protein